VDVAVVVSVVGTAVLSVVVAVLVNELVAVLVNELDAVELAVDVGVIVLVMLLVAEDVNVVLTVVVAVDVCVLTHALHPTGHMSAILTPNKICVQSYEPTNFAQLPRSSLPLHKPWVVGVVDPVDVADDVAVVVAVVTQLSVASIVFFVRFCFTIVFNA